MLADIIQVETEPQRDQVRALFEEYLSFLAPPYRQEFGVTVDLNRAVEADMALLAQLLSPHLTRGGRDQASVCPPAASPSG